MGVATDTGFVVFNRVLANNQSELFKVTFYSMDRELNKRGQRDFNLQVRLVSDSC